MVYGEYFANVFFAKLFLVFYKMCVLVYNL